MKINKQLRLPAPDAGREDESSLSGLVSLDQLDNFASCLVERAFKLPGGIF